MAPIPTLKVTFYVLLFGVFVFGTRFVAGQPLTTPTIGIGAGNACDGQILVYMDMLGMFSDYTPKFVKHFAELGKELKEAFAAYDREVKSGAFPDAAHAFGAIAKD